MAHAGGKTRKIVNGADQDNSECYPQQARQPAKGQTRGDWTRNRARRGDGREVLTKKIKALGGNKVFTVVNFMGGCGSLVIKR